MHTSTLPQPRLVDIPEIVDEITQYFGRSTLSKLARVCTSLHYSSIQRLWSGLVLQRGEEQIDKHGDISRHLWGLVPSDPETWSVINFKSSVWDRLKHYSVYVKAIQISNDHYWRQLFAICNGHLSELFPRLQKISIRWKAAIHNPRLKWLIFPGVQLKSLRIYQSEGDPDRVRCIQTLESVCRYLATQTPDLEELSFDNLLPDPETPTPSSQHDSLCAAVQSLGKLRSFCWQSGLPLLPNTLETLSTLPLLSRLSINLSEPPLISTLVGPKFPSLRRLKLVTPDSPRFRVDSWLQKLSQPSLLTHLVLTSRIPLSFQTRNLAVVELSDQQITWSDFAPVLSCKSIRICKVSSNRQMDNFEDSSLGAIASSWRDLEELTINAPGCQTDVTPLGFAPLAMSCLKLRILHVHVTLDLERLYGHMWQEGYYRVLGGSYPPGTLYALSLVVSSPAPQGELADKGPGSVGVAHLIRKLWPLFKPSGLRESFVGGRAPSRTLQATMRLLMSQEMKSRNSL